MARIWPGRPSPLGATFDGIGTNVAVFSEVAQQVEVCLFDDDGTEARVPLSETTGHVWHGYLPDVGPGTRYGFRVHGPHGGPHRCNPAKLLIDPYARALEGEVQWGQAVFSYPFGHPDRIDTTDSASSMPKSVVSNPYFDWEGDVLPRTPWNDTVIYEVHVKGATMRHPDIEPELRGTYTGLADPAFVEHITKLGVTAVELLPVHAFVHDAHLVEKGLRNYWGYNTIGFFAPHAEYAHRHDRGEQLQEFKAMVKELHRAGLEVILDVVYNHTAEGNHLGPTLSMKGIDNAAYYRLMHDEQRFYMDYTGTGNSLNMRHPHTLQLVMDSLRYWVNECHVDGFRFDLASTLARGLHEVDRLSAFFDLIQQDPVVNQVKLIAEPWDIGEGGYQVGNFPPVWVEWNGRYRDSIRDLWRGASHTIDDFGYRFTGSSDLYERSGRRPFASVNFITAHDGFTLNDLVSYDEKHNEANGEANRDGSDDNRSWNCGVEGPTDDPDVVALRARQRRNLLSTLLLSQGVPMLVAGDEMGRTQGGNNNAYCQDNVVSWLDWTAVDYHLLMFARSLVALRTQHRTFCRRKFFDGRPIHGNEVSDLLWFRPDGEEMGDEEWARGHVRSLAVYLNGEHFDTDGRGQPLEDDDFLVLVNASETNVTFRVPECLGGTWDVVLDTQHPTGEGGWREVKAGHVIASLARSLVVLEKPRDSS
ncbi:MAG: GH13_11 / GH13 / GH13_13 / GH13_10 / CBM 48 / GH13_37 / GH13_14 / GH13_36 [uncultured Acidimicrobiales bacterium]|uniref:GH13_11 / GH13 / GH13_13 / GH13_10 / CBM 48 / GH13_37 / GH13_14 / GH13_36 n=1 Tax=uncultured Acidimicrobiales bacterium TaxID=310071 RepID=A0A6J4IN35_9ACTN|nr:MAG: GH13_11 / GH13 / GH13_13 / GH13_10 / CBM 48 / GH13_37 / GH13_14 / GH13_36 [uncultured Acidimicrobiales bacterium]